MPHGSRAALLVTLWLVAAATAAAQIPEAARTSFAEGKYIIAATLAEGDGSADALAFASRARIADAITREEGLCGECLAEAEATAEAAIKRDPGNAEAHVQLAIAIGFRGRLVGPLEAQAEGLVEKGRAAIDRALECDPNSIWARASLGGWHLEIVHRAGSILAAVLYGANEEDGLADFRKALKADPDSLLLNYHFALSVLALDQERFKDEALAALAAGGRDAQTDALTAFMRARALTLEKTLKAGSADEIAALVHRYQGYPGD